MSSLLQYDSALVCTECGVPITGQCLLSFGLPWHPSCLSCSVCGVTFDKETVFEGADGEPYCQRDYINAFAPTCVACNKPISGEYNIALAKNWHIECFTCNKCHKPLGVTFFPTPDGKLFCREDIWESIKMVCAECEKPIITGSVVEMGEKKFHVDHFKCNFCKKPLANAEYYEKDGKPFCKKDFIVLFG